MLVQLADAIKTEYPRVMIGKFDVVANDLPLQFVNVKRRFKVPALFFIPAYEKTSDPSLFGGAATLHALKVSVLSVFRIVMVVISHRR